MLKHLICNSFRPRIVVGAQSYASKAPPSCVDRITYCDSALKVKHLIIALTDWKFFTVSDPTFTCSAYLV